MSDSEILARLTQNLDDASRQLNWVNGEILVLRQELGAAQKAARHCAELAWLRGNLLRETERHAQELLAERDEARAEAVRLGVALARVQVCLAAALADAEEQQPGDWRSGEQLIAAMRRAYDFCAGQFPELKLNAAPAAPDSFAPPRE